MKLKIILLAAVFAVSGAFAQTSKQAATDKADTKTSTIVKKPTQAKQSTPPQKQPTNAVTPSNQKKPVTPVNPNKPAVVPPANKPVAATADITGYWLTANRSNIVQFYRNGDSYNGKIVWVRNNKDKKGRPLTDVNIPDKSKRNNPIVGTVMVTNLKYNAKTKTYEGGKAYLPQTGKTFGCKAKLTGNNNALQVTAMAGLSMMSKTLTWTRTTGVPSK